MDLLTALRTGAKPKKRITIAGQTRTTKQWAQHLGMTPSGFRTRMLRGGDESKMAKPHQRHGTISAFGRTQSLVAWSRETGIHKGTLFTRIRSGLPPEMALTIPIDTSRKRK
jgi:hypothetical protein